MFRIQKNLLIAAAMVVLAGCNESSATSVKDFLYDPVLRDTTRNACVLKNDLSDQNCANVNRAFFLLVAND